MNGLLVVAVISFLAIVFGITQVIAHYRRVKLRELSLKNGAQEQWWRTMRNESRKR
jgi:hypothetical protein